MERSRRNDGREQNDDPDCNELHRQVTVGSLQLGPRSLRSAAEIAQSHFEAVPNGWKRANQAKDTTCRYGTCTDVQHIRFLDDAGRHSADRAPAREHHTFHHITEEFHHRDQHEIREHASCAHDRTDTRPDDVADPK